MIIAKTLQFLLLLKVIPMIRLLTYSIVFLMGVDVGAETLQKISKSPLNGKMKILMVVGKFPLLSETFIINQIMGLLDRGHDVSIYSPEKPIETILNNDIYSYNIMSRAYFQILPPNLASFDVIIGQFGTAGLDALQNIKKKHPEVKAKLVTFFRGYDISAFLSAHPGAYDQLLKEGDLFLAECDFFRKRLISLGADPSRTLVHYSSIQSARFKYTPHAIGKDGKIHVVTVSRLVEKKGIEDALKAMQKVIARSKHVDYTIIGDGDLKEKLMVLAKDLGIQQRVKFAGAKKPIEVAQYLNSSHIFVLPCVVGSDNNIDGVPTVLKEAMACGLPIVSTFVSGIPEIVHNGKSGFLVQAHDIESLSEKIAFLIDHPENWKAMGAYGRKFVETKCDINVLNDELEKILLRVTAKQR